MSLPSSSTTFDLERYRTGIAEHFFKALRPFRRPRDTEALVEAWLQLLTVYAQSDGFRHFEPRVPLLDRLVPAAVAVVVVPFQNTAVPLRQLRCVASVLPLYPFRVRTLHRTFCCKEGFSLLMRYLTLTGIRLVCLYGVYGRTADQTTLELQRQWPDLRLYEPALFFTFLRVVRRAAVRGGPPATG